MVAEYGYGHNSPGGRLHLQYLPDWDLRLVRGSLGLLSLVRGGQRLPVLGACPPFGCLSSHGCPVLERGLRPSL